MVVKLTQNKLNFFQLLETLKMKKTKNEQSITSLVLDGDII